jgi:DNA mismatch repair protein MutL
MPAVHPSAGVAPPLPARIHRLPPALANQIAAGEVVERPASVAKELVENSLDAGARHVEVEAEEGGVALLRVRDDGVGILREDLPLALDRHATSKVATLDDLLQVATLGFRGEALPSIASIARLLISSRPAGQAEGWQVRAEGGAPPGPPVPCAHPFGTTVEVRDLFFNVPARRKFLRSAATELAHLEAVVRRLALARFDVGVRLRHQRRDLLAVRPASDEAGRARRLVAVCGAGFLEQALPIEAEREGLRLSGWAGLPDAARSQADLQYLFLNGRPVRDRTLAHALRQVYQDRVFPGRHPVFVLYLEIDPGEVDVNVHPTKQEVRFRDTRAVHDLVYGSVLRALDGPALVPASPVVDPGPASAVRPPAAGAPSPRAVRETRSTYAALAGAPAPAESVRPAGRLLGLVHGRWLLAETGRGLVLADGPAVAARLAGERLRAALAAGQARPRPLLVPAPVEVGEAAAQAAEDHRALCLALGLDLERSGPATVTVRQVPTVLQDLTPARLARGALVALAAGGGGVPADRLIGALGREAGARVSEGAEAEALEVLVRALGEDPAPGQPPLWRVLAPEEIARLLGAPAAPAGPPAG